MIVQDDGLNGNPNNKTDMWLKSPQSTKYTLPQTCPTCNAVLQTDYVYIGVFPYIHTGVNMKCHSNPEHEFTFCFPYNQLMPAGYTIFDSAENTRYKTEKTCPFHPEIKLVPTRLYGDLVFNEGTKKMQLRCPTCNYSVRVTFKKS